jgi:hypothetical protein
MAAVVARHGWRFRTDNRINSTNLITNFPGYLDGTVIELDKNRKLDGDVVIKNGKEGIVARIELSDIRKADFFAA